MRIGALGRRGAGAARLARLRQGSTSPIRATCSSSRSTASSSAYFNVDNGTGAIRGVYLQGNEAVAPDLRGVDEAVPQPRHDDADDRRTRAAPTTWPSTRSVCPASSSSRTRSSTDTRTHHSNMDVYERLQAADLMKNAVIVASFVYQAANRDEPLPRKPLPKAQPPPAATPARQTHAELITYGQPREHGGSRRTPEVVWEGCEPARSSGPCVDLRALRGTSRTCDLASLQARRVRVAQCRRSASARSSASASVRKGLDARAAASTSSSPRPRSPGC